MKSQLKLEFMVFIMENKVLVLKKMVPLLLEKVDMEEYFLMEVKVF
jgi:hypothetical protein